MNKKIALYISAMICFSLYLVALFYSEACFLFYFRGEPRITCLGEVHDIESQVPIKNAVVTIQSDADISYPKSITKENGEFLIFTYSACDSPIPTIPNHYLIAAASGYETEKQKIQIGCELDKRNLLGFRKEYNHTIHYDFLLLPVAK